MNTRKITRNIIIALCITFTLTISSLIALGQNKTDQSSDTRLDEQGNTLVGVWESVGPATVDCQTGLPAPDEPIIRVLYKFNEGGTMEEENTDPIEGPYRTTGHGIWKRVAGQNYAAVYTHYGFDTDRTHNTIIKVRTNITLNQFINTLIENGTFEVLDPDGNPLLDPKGNPIRGCFSGTYKRLTF